MPDFDAREQAAFDRTVELFGGVQEGLVVGDGTWRVRDVLAHLVTVVRRYTTLPELAETPRGVDELNARELAGLAGATVDALLADYTAGFAAYRSLWTAMPAEHLWPFHGGGQLTTTAVRRNWLAEMVVHGYDVATAAGVDWPIDDPDAADLLSLVQAIVPTYCRAGETAALGVLPDGLPGWSLQITPDAASVGAPDGFETAIAGPPAVLALLFYGRLDTATGAARGLRVTGDASVADRVLGQLERP